MCLPSLDGPSRRQCDLDRDGMRGTASAWWPDVPSVAGVLADSGSMAIAAALWMAAVSLVGTAGAVRAAVPRATALASVAASARSGPLEVASSVRGTAAPVAAILAIAAIWWLVVRGHLLGGPAALLYPTAWTALAMLAAGTAVRRARRTGPRQIPVARRLPHLVTATLAAEMVIATAAAAAAWAMSHTAGVMVSQAELLGAVVVARALTFLPILPAGAPVADLAMISTLHAVGVPVEAAVATLLLWRCALLVAAATAAAAARLPAAHAHFDHEQHGSRRVGDLLHRAAFALCGAAPAPLSAWLRRRSFDMLFSWSDDPWEYDRSAYERSKRHVLMSAVPPGARLVVELGCAEGHNLRAIATGRPGARVVGIDVSAKAVAAARARAEGASLWVEVLQSEARHAADALTRHGISGVDTVIIAETLYYLGGPRRVAAELLGLRQVLAPGATVVLLHPVLDAERLHHAALSALAARTVSRREVGDPQRPYVVETALTVPAIA